MYYTGRPYPHACERYPRGSIKVTGAPGGVARAVVRPGGFVARVATARGAELVTVPLQLTGARLAVNMDAGAGGALKAEILDSDGHALDGFAETDADWADGNALARTLTWQGSAELSALHGKHVRLRFLGRDVKLYAFRDGS